MDVEDSGNDDSDSQRRELAKSTAPQRSLLFWFVLILGINVAGLLWLSVRAQSPDYLRGVLDAFFHTAAGGAVAYFAFRALLRYPYRFPDLLIIVTILSLGMKATLQVLASFEALGVLHASTEAGVRYGQMFQICLLTGSVLLAGAALGLHNCHTLKISATGVRLMCITAGMLALPAAAGTAAFPVLLVSEFAGRARGDVALLFLLRWVGSVVITVININYFIRSLILKTEVQAQEMLTGRRGDGETGRNGNSGKP
jgi:hypothetical protein